MDPTRSSTITGPAGLRALRDRPHVEDVRAIPMRERALERQATQSVAKVLAHRSFEPNGVDEGSRSVLPVDVAVRHDHDVVSIDVDDRELR